MDEPTEVSVMDDAHRVADRYAAVWTETDPERRERWKWFALGVVAPG